jgi:hypothetical protein
MAREIALRQAARFRVIVPTPSTTAIPISSVIAIPNAV